MSADSETMVLLTSEVAVLLTLDVADSITKGTISDKIILGIVVIALLGKRLFKVAVTKDNSLIIPGIIALTEFL